MNSNILVIPAKAGIYINIYFMDPPVKPEDDKWCID